MSTEWNPYDAPRPVAMSGGSAGMAVSHKLPTFCQVMFIIDLVFCGLRIPLTMLGVMAVIVMREAMDGDPLLATSYFEVATGLGIILFGLPANIGLLLKQSWAVTFGWLLVAATAASFVVGLWQAGIQIGAAQHEFAGGPEVIGAIFGGVCALFIRLLLLGLYVAALVKFAEWDRNRQPREMF